MSEASKPLPGSRRILLVITDLDVGGAEKCCVELAESLRRAGWRPQVCSLLPPGKFADRLAQSSIPVHSLDVRGGWSATLAVWKLARLMRRLRPAIVHTFLFHANVVGRLAARLAGSPRVVSSIRVAERRYRYHLIAENLTCRFSDRVTCVSHAVARFVHKHSHVPRSRLIVIENGVEVDSHDRTERGACAAIEVPSRAVIALYVGRLDPQKGVDVLLRAAAESGPRAAGVHLVLAGAGPQRRELERLAEELGLKGRAHFLGWRADVPALLRAADLLVLPSRWEGMPNVVLEAMAASLPVIATRTEGTTELVRHGETGLLVRVDDSGALAGALAELAHDAARRAAMGRLGRERAMRYFSLELMIRRYRELYESLGT